MNQSPTWFEHVDLMQVMITALVLVVAWFLIRTLNKVDRNQDLLFKRQERLEKDFYVMRGEHNSNHKWPGDDRRNL